VTDQQRIEELERKVRRLELIIKEIADNLGIEDIPEEESKTNYQA